MSAVGGTEFSRTLETYTKFLESEVANKEDLNHIVSKFASTIKESGQLQSNASPELAHALARFKEVSDKYCSSGVQARMNAVFNQAFDFHTKKFDEGMTTLMRGLSPDAAEAFAEIHTEDGPQAAIQQLKGVLQDKDNLLAFIGSGDKEFVQDMLFLCDINVNTPLDKEGNTLLHYAAAKGADTRTIQGLVDQGAKTNSANTEGKTAIEVAIGTNDIANVKAFIRAGIKVPLQQMPLAGKAISPEMQKYVAKQVLKEAANGIRLVAEAPKKPSPATPLGIPQGPLGHAATALGAAPGGVFVKAALPIIKNTDYKLEIQKGANANKELDQKLGEIREKIATLEGKIEGAKEPLKSNLIRQKKGLENELKFLEASGKAENRQIELEIHKKAIGVQQGVQAVAEKIAPNTAVMSSFLKASTNVTGAVTAALTVFQNIHQISDLRVKREYLQEVKTGLTSSYMELRRLKAQLPADSPEARLIEMKSLAIQQHFLKVNGEIEKADADIAAKKLTVVTVATAGTLMAYATLQYFNRMYAGDDRSQEGVNALVDKAGLMATVGGLIPTIKDSLPAVITPLKSGLGWLWSKGAAALGAGPTETQFEREKRLNNEEEAALLKEKSSLESEFAGNKYELEEGIPIAFGVIERPEPGSKEFTQLTNRQKEIESRLGVVNEALAEHQDAKKFGITRDNFNKQLAGLKRDLENEESREFIISILKANGISEERLAADPEGSLIEYLTK